MRYWTTDEGLFVGFTARYVKTREKIVNLSIEPSKHT